MANKVSFDLSGRISTPSGNKAVTTQVLTGAGALTGLTVQTNGVADATVTVYDNTSAAGTVLTIVKVAAANFQGSYDGPPIYCATGLHCVLAGASAAFQASYIEK